ncbi:hypothetical protein BTZ20_1422 [Rhodococcus sp. MTM3W5.2]|nr:hypothetical protein BTZ20_1422 [Rhodococcus sp. MTM3W5.2]
MRGLLGGDRHGDLLLLVNDHTATAAPPGAARLRIVLKTNVMD